LFAIATAEAWEMPLQSARNNCSTPGQAWENATMERSVAHVVILRAFRLWQCSPTAIKDMSVIPKQDLTSKALSSAPRALMK
jgi:hypothetical protein